MSELKFAYKSKLEVSDPQGIDFNASGKIYILIGDIAPQDIFEQFTHYLWDVKQTTHDFANEWRNDLNELYQNAEVEIDYDATYTDFQNTLNTSDTIGVVFVGHGGEGILSFTDSALLPTFDSVRKTDLQFLFLFACQAGIEVDGKTWKTEIEPGIYYAPEEAIRFDSILPFLDTLATEGDQLIDELRDFKKGHQK